MDVVRLTHQWVALCTGMWFSFVLCAAVSAVEKEPRAEAWADDAAAIVIVDDSPAAPAALKKGPSTAPTGATSRASMRRPARGTVLAVVANAARQPVRQPITLAHAAQSPSEDVSHRDAQASDRGETQDAVFASDERIAPVSSTQEAATALEALPAVYTAESPEAAELSESARPMGARGGRLQRKAGAPQRDAMATALLKAHRLSQAAESEKSLTEIVLLCRAAVQASETELESDAREFAATLSSWALNRRGQLRTEQKQDDRALADFDAAVQLDPDNWRALHNRGVTYAQRSDFAAAFDDFSRVILANPQFAKAFANRATLYVHAGNVDEALGDYQRAVEIDPAMAAAHLGRGRVCHSLGRMEEALAHFNAAIGCEPENADAICSRADLEADMGKYAEALGDYAKAIEINPSLSHAYRNGSWLLATCPDERFRDGENALRGAEQAMKLGAGERHADLDAFAAALACCGRFPEAVAAAQQALDAAPEESKAVYQARLELYESRQPFYSEPAIRVEQASYSPASTPTGKPTDDRGSN